jgi:uncharacterized protein DUF4265
MSDMVPQAPAQQLKKVAVPLPPGAPTAEETLWAQPLGDHLYRLDNTPWFARGVALGDVVRCEDSGEGLPRFLEVVEPSGSRTVRVFVPDTPDRQRVKQEIFQFLESAGCKYEGFGKDKGLIAVTIPRDVDAQKVLERLSEYQGQGKAYWESGNF